MIEVLKHKLVVKTLMNLKSVTQEYDEQHKDDDDSNLQKIINFLADLAPCLRSR